MNHRIRAALTTTGLLACLATAAIAQEPASTKQPSLDEQLDGSVGEDLFGEPLTQETPALPGGIVPEEGVLDASSQEAELDKLILQQLGEDIGQADAPGDDPLQRISERMRLAGERIAGRDVSGKASDLQRQAMDDLDSLIRQLRQQRAQQPKSGSGRQQSTRSQVKPQQGKQPGSQAGTQTARTPAADSTTRQGQAEAVEEDLGPIHELQKEFWGHLPRRVREQMLEQPYESFLPEFELEIERYFRRLAEDPEFDDRPRDTPRAN